MKIISTNRKARHNYDIIQTYEAGIELKGNEVKSLRNKNCSIENSFARIENQEVILYDMHIPEYDKSSYFKTDPKRPRKLLLHKKEIEKLYGYLTRKGFTIIPLKVYFNDRGLVKLEIALAKGRLLYDKRRKIKEDIAKREIEREMKKVYKKY